MSEPSEVTPTAAGEASAPIGAAPVTAAPDPAAPAAVPIAVAAIPSQSFAYRAQTAEGRPISGTIDATDAEHAGRLLRSLRLNVLEIAPLAQATPRPKALRGDDFFAFNQQLTHLTRAGLPVEHGLRLIAQDMRGGRLKETVRQL